MTRPAATATRRRRAVLLAGMAVLTVAGAVLAVTGLSTVQNSTAGSYAQTTTPQDPGYQALVIPTPTMAVLQPTAEGDLAGAWLLALEPGDEGGSVILVPPATVVPEQGGGDTTTIADVYRRDGAAAAAQALGLVLMVAVAETTEVDEGRWTSLVEPVGSVEVTLDDPVGEWDAGAVTLQPSDVARFLATRGDGESDLERLERQQIFWNAWLPLVAAGGEVALPGEVDTGIGRFVRAVALGEGSAAALPVRRDDGGGAVRFEPDADLVGDFVAQTVPYPTAPVPGARVRVRLLNGTSDPELTSVAARELVAAGAEITLAGNAETLDVAETTLAYTGAGNEPLAERLQTGLGGGRLEEMTGGQDEPVASDEEIDVTVILGKDAEELIREEDQPE